MAQNSAEKYPSPGYRFDNDIYPGAQQRGIRQYPVGGVLSGATVTATIASASPTGSTISVVLAPGTIKLDATTIVIPAALTKVISVAEDLSVGVLNPQVIPIYINPTRVVPAQSTAPVSPANGDKYLKTVDYADYQQIDQFLTYNGTLSTWVPFDPIKEKIGYGQFALPFNDVKPAITIANIVGKTLIEKTVYNPTGLPVYVNTMAPALARNCAAIVVAEITVANGVITGIVTPSAQTLIN
jgi:hypothetical protein